MDLLLGDQLVLGVHGNLDVVADTNPAAGVHGTRIRIGQRDLLLATFRQGLAVGSQLGAAFPDCGYFLLQLRDRAPVWPTIIVPISSIERLEITRQAFVACFHLPLQFGLRDVPVPAVHGLDSGAVHRDQLTPEQVQFPTKPNKFPEHLTECRPVVATEIGDRLEIRRQPAQQPDHFQIAMALRLEAVGWVRTRFRMRSSTMYRAEFSLGQHWPTICAAPSPSSVSQC